MGKFTDEIRINPKYAHFYKAEYDKTLHGDSTPIIHKNSLLTNDYLRRMTTGLVGGGPSVLPPNCRYIEHLKQGTIVVVEEPPAFRTIRIHMDFSREVKKLKEDGKLEEYGYPEDFAQPMEAKSFNLAFPYVIFILYFNNYHELSAGQSFLRVARLTGLSDYLLKIPVTNISDSQYICFGDKTNGQSETLNSGVEKVINVFWGAEFNTDYTYNYSSYKNVAGVNTYMEWQALSASNPMFIYNVDWMKVPMNVGQAVEEVKRHYKLTGNTDMEYRNLASMFAAPLDSGKDEAPSNRSRKKYRLFYDVAEGLFLDEKYYVHVRDPLKIKHDKSLCYINSFISFQDSGSIKYIRVEREDGRLLIWKFTKAVLKYIKDRTKELRFDAEGVLKNGVVIKEDDILKMKNAIGMEVYKKVAFVRTSPEGFHEGRFGDGFYILENTEGEIYDTSKPEFKGIKLKKNAPYLFVNLGQDIPYTQASVVTFTGVDTDTSGHLNLQFESKDRNLSNDYNLRLNQLNNGTALFEMDKVKPLPPVFRVGRKLLATRKNGSRLLEDSVFGTPYGIGLEQNYGGVDKPTTVEIKEYLLGDDKFKVQSFDLDIEFAIGDKVVVADWENPINMLSVKMIQGFKFDETYGHITFILADKQGALHQVPYVDGRNGVIHTGTIRKVTNKFGKLVAGTKIKSKLAGVAHFPKKDTNIIIGFVTDTGGPEPLVLCSNCCTLWYSDVVENFDKISIKSKKWAATPHVPIDVAKIKYQPGDIIKSTDSGSYSVAMGWIAFKVNGSQSLKLMDFRYYTQWPDYFGLDRYVTTNSTFDSIIGPRLGPKVQSEMNLKRAWPNLHGYFFACQRSKFQFLNDERSMINVQSSPE